MPDPDIPATPTVTSAAITWKKILGGIFFLPYGKNLLTPSAIYWILAMWIVAGLMAVSEGIAVYEMGNTFSGGRIVVALITAIGWAGVIWMFDATFIMYDLSPLQHSQETDPQQQTFWKRISSNPLLRTIVIRAVLILISVLVTLPFLAAVVQREELIKKIDAHNMNEIAKLIKNEPVRIKKTHDDGPIKKAKEELTELEDNKALECAGKPYRTKANPEKAQGSLIPKCGLVAQTFDQRIADKKLEIENLTTARNKEVSNALELIANNKSTPEGRELLRLAFEKSPDFTLLSYSPTDMEHARTLYLSESGVKIIGLPAEQVIASAGILVVFLVMMALKFMEPQSIKHYYDSLLQENYRRYLGRGFDKKIPAPEQRSTGSTPMEAHEFYKYFYEIYPLFQLSAEQEKEIATHQKSKKLQETKLTDLNAKLATLKTESDNEARRHDEIKKKIDELIATKNEEKNQKIVNIDQLLHSEKEMQKVMKSRISQLKQQEKDLEQQEEDLNQEIQKKEKSGISPLSREYVILESTKDAREYARSEHKKIQTKRVSQDDDLRISQEKCTALSTQRDELNTPISPLAESQELKRVTERLVELDEQRKKHKADVNAVGGHVNRCVTGVQAAVLSA